MSVKISELTETTSVASSDFLVLNTSSGTKKITSANLQKANTDALKVFSTDPVAAHNSIYRGKVLVDTVGSAGTYSIDQLHALVNAGNFSDIYVGDVIRVSLGGTTRDLVVSAIDWYIHTGDTELTKHHLVLVPSSIIGNASMNATNTTAGGYYGSVMHTTTLQETYLPLFQTALGTDRVISYRDILSNSVDTDAASGAYSGLKGASNNWAWYDVKIRLLNEVDVYGTRVLSSSFYDVGTHNRQLPAFRLNPRMMSRRALWWLSSVANSNAFAIVYYFGGADHGSASGSAGVVPMVLFN